MTAKNGDTPGVDLRPHVVYRFHDHEGELLYVGVTCQIDIRLAQHRLYSKWWPMVSATTLDDHPDRCSALLAEKNAIAAEKPLFNVNYPGRWSRVCELVGEELAARARYLVNDLRIPTSQASQALGIHPGDIGRALRGLPPIDYRLPARAPGAGRKPRDT